VNGSEILHLIRHDLQRAVAERGEPPTSQPMDASPWVAMSAMQKAIRRGREDLALSAAATLLRDAPDKLWRRIGCIAFEDVGLASLEAVGLATVALAGKRHRAALGGECAVASCVVAELSKAPKCRAADDLLMASELHPAYAEARAELPYLTTCDLMTVVTGQGSVHERALALWYALGTDRDRSSLAPRRGDPQAVFEQLCEAGWPHTIVEIAREGFRRTRTVLCPLIALLACEPRQIAQTEDDDLPAEDVIGDVPGWALDIYTREGRTAFARLLETDAPAARWIRRNVRQARRVSFLGHIVFRVEGGLVADRMRWPLAEELCRQVDVECTGPGCPDATEILELMRDDIPRLNKVRAAVMGATRELRP
jgi:MgsA AAA+ ATPase C terminal